MGISFSSFAARRNDHGLARRLEIRQERSRGSIPNQGSDRYRNHSRLSSPAMLIFPASMLSSTGLVLFLITEVQQGCELVIRPHHHVTSVATISPVRPASRHEFLSPKAHAAAPPIAGFDLYFDFVDKLHGIARNDPLFAGKKKAPRGAFALPERPLLGNDAHPFSLPIEALVLNNPVDFRKQRKVSPHPDISSRVDSGSELSHEDIARPHCLSTEDFDPSPLPLTVAPVSRTASCFLMSHFSTSETMLESRLFSIW